MYWQQIEHNVCKFVNQKIDDDALFVFKFIINFRSVKAFYNFRSFPNLDGCLCTIEVLE